MSISNRKTIAILLLFFIAFFLFRVDFSYSGREVHIKEHDTLWQYLTENVFHDPQLTALSIQHINQSVSSNQTDYLQANVDLEGGDRVYVRNNILHVVGPDNNERYSSLLFPDHALENHWYQIMAHNVVVVAFFVYLYLLLHESQFKFSLQTLIDQIGYFAVIGIGIPLGIVAIGIIYFHINQFFNPPPEIYQFPSYSAIEKRLYMQDRPIITGTISIPVLSPQTVTIPENTNHREGLIDIDLLEKVQNE